MNLPRRVRRAAICGLAAILHAAAASAAPPANSEAGYKVYEAARLAPVGELFVLDPFLLGAPSLANLDLSVVLPQLASLSDARARGIATDGSAAAIALWRTSANAPVLFRVEPGVSLLPYRKTFLNERPAYGLRRLVVKPDAFVKIGQYYYAPVLVQSPPSYASWVPPVGVYITATQGANSRRAWLNLVPAPVLFVHGLWGNGSSLSELNTYLSGRAPWKSRAILRRFAYDGTLRFDDPDTMKTVASVIREIYGELDRQHVVGGRVDAVAHSMGGLVLRKFMTTADYRSLRTRRLGKLAQVVTLDTPQLGSALAKFLLDHRDNRARHPEYWVPICGIDPRTTVAQCFEANDLSLWGPIKGNPASGAVWSLVPGNPVLVAAPRLSSNSDIRWTNVTAVLRNSDDSILRFAVQQLLRAISRDPDEAPTPTSILGNVTNDVIVTWRSQSNGSLPADTPRFFGLAHSDFKQLNLPPIANDAVVNSQRVFSYVTCRLRRPAVTCTPVTEPSAAELAALRGSEPRSSSGRPARGLVLSATTQGTLGSPLEFSTPLGAARIEHVAVAQQNEAGDRAGAEPSVFQITGGILRLGVTPRLLGHVTFTVGVYGSDGTISVGHVASDVKSPPSGPTAVLGDNPYHDVHVSLGSARLLTPSGVFAGVEGEVPLTGQATYRVLEGAEDIRIDGNRLTGLRAGSARVEARLGGAADIMTVVVDP